MTLSASKLSLWERKKCIPKTIEPTPSNPSAQDILDLLNEADLNFVEAAIHTAAAIVTYNVKDFRWPELSQHGWTVMTPQEFLARYT